MQHLGLIGLLLILLAAANWFWRAWRVNVPKPYVFQAFLLVGIALGLVALILGHQDAVAPWTIGVGVLLVYLTATGGQRLADGAIDIGQTIPTFIAPDDKDNEFSSASLSGSRVLLKFFRGHW
ncbi:MAG: hypothetical protein AAF387_10810 [Pseudomonadota bacterium]